MDTIQPEIVGFDSNRLKRVKPAMQAYIDNKTFAGMLTLASRRGKLFHAESFGMMDLKAGKPMQFDTIFRIYSMTKAITSTAIMILFEEGKLHLYDPISKFIPGFKDVKVYSGTKDDQIILVKPDREITFRDLLTHTSGLSYGGEGIPYIDDMYGKYIWSKMDKPGETLASMMEALPLIPLIQQPGSAFHYSIATDVLGYLVQIISGIPFETFLKEKIFDPLGMVDTGFYVPAEKIDRFACNYGRGDDGEFVDIDPIEKSPYLNPHRVPSGGGGLVSTASDYMQFCHMLINRGVLDGVRLLSPKTVELMRVNHLADGVYATPDKSTGFGLGFCVVLDVAKTQNLGSLGVYGWGGAATTYFRLDPVEEIVFLQMIQFIPNNITPVDVDFTNLIYQALIK